jgi:hypothetical protein
MADTAPDSANNAAMRFWQWFVANKDRIESLFESQDTEGVIAEIDSRVKGINSGLQWEIGPGRSKPFAFAFSLSGDAALLELTKEAAQIAPRIDKWEILPAKPPKHGWNLTFEMSNRRQQIVRIDASKWDYYLTAFSNGSFFDLVFVAGNLQGLDSAARRIAAQIVAEGILGEEILLRLVDRIELRTGVPSDVRNRLSPIMVLAEHFSNVRKSAGVVAENRDPPPSGPLPKN